MCGGVLLSEDTLLRESSNYSSNISLVPRPSVCTDILRVSVHTEGLGTRLCQHPNTWHYTRNLGWHFRHICWSHTFPTNKGCCWQKQRRWHNTRGTQALLLAIQIWSIHVHHRLLSLNHLMNSAWSRNKYILGMILYHTVFSNLLTFVLVDFFSVN